MFHRPGAIALVLFLLCLILFVPGLTTGDLWRTEGLRAAVAAEALRSGNWLLPTLYGEPLLTKPPGMYAAIAALSWPFGGVTTWSARLPSVLAATATALLFFWYFARQLGRHGGLVAALVLPLSCMFLDKVPSAEIDMLQTAWVSASILFFLRALENEEGDSPAVGWWLAAFLCVAGGVLTKWTAPAFFYGTALPLLWWRRRLRLLVGWGHVAGVALAAGICLSWAALAIHAVGWEEFAGTVTREALQRLSFVHHEETARQLPANHQPTLPTWAAMLVHPFVIWGTALPGSLFALLTLRPGFVNLWDERGKRLLQALHCWVWPNLLFWSVLPDHATRHCCPLMPGIAGLAAMVWAAWLNGWPVLRPWRVGRVFVGMLLVWIVIKLAFAEGWLHPRLFRGPTPGSTGETIAAVVPAEQTLYLCRLKDEGVMFYYGRRVRRLATLSELASCGELTFCILEEREWQHWPSWRSARAVLRLRDQQGAAIVLVQAGPQE